MKRNRIFDWDELEQYMQIDRDYTLVTKTYADCIDLSIRVRRDEGGRFSLNYYTGSIRWTFTDNLVGYSVDNALKSFINTPENNSKRACIILGSLISSVNRVRDHSQ